MLNSFNLFPSPGDHRRTRLAVAMLIGGLWWLPRPALAQDAPASHPAPGTVIGQAAASPIDSGTGLQGNAGGGGAGAAALPSPVSPAGVPLSAEVDLAFTRNPAMTQAAGKLRASEARLSEELALRFPQYGLTTSLTETKASGYSPFPSLNSVLSIPIDTVGRNGDLARQARADLGAAWWGFRRTQSDLAYQVATAYYGVLRASQESAIAADALAQANAQQDAAQKRFNAGDVPQTDILRAEVQVAQARSESLQAANAERLAEATLNNTTGGQLHSAVTLSSGDTLVTMPPSLDALEPTVPSVSPEVVSARAGLESAQAALALARTEGRPQLSLQGTFSHTGDPTTYPDALGAGISVVVPLPDGGARRSRERQAEAAVAQARASLNLAQRQAVLDLENAYLSAQDARQRVDTTSDAVRLAAESLRAASLGYANNVASTRDVLDAQVALRQSRIQHAEAIYDYNLSVARIGNVLGGAPSGAALTPVPLWAVPAPGAATAPSDAISGSDVPGKQNG